MSILEEFRFLDPGPLVDRELELVTPDERWIDDMLETLAHPLTRRFAPRDAELTREQWSRFVRNFPLGRQQVDPDRNQVPAYHFWMRIRNPEVVAGRGALRPRISMAGTLCLRVGHTQNLEMYLGHVGYLVYPPARGNHYARRSVRLLLPLARRLGLNPLWITCDPSNLASRRTCEGLGGRLVETVSLPPDHPLQARGEREKCRYRVDL